jgi:hypothetical protein
VERLLELVAEDAALEDTIYHLSRGLNSEEANIDLERFTKVRLLSLSCLDGTEGERVEGERTGEGTVWEESDGQ